jgi:hypothetical protein
MPPLRESTEINRCFVFIGLKLCLGKQQQASVRLFTGRQI